MDNSPVHTTLDVRNFGPIVRARVVLRPLTVFAGPGNTGKSYLATLIYALHRHFSTRREEMRYGRPADPPALRAALAEWMRSMDEGGKSAAAGRIALPEPLRAEIRRRIHEQGAYLEDELRRCFGLGEDRSLTRKGSRQNARIVLQTSSARGSVLFEQAFDIGSSGPDAVRTVISEALSLPADDPAPPGGDLAERDSLRRPARIPTPMVVREEDARWNALSGDLLDRLTDRILPQLSGALHARAQYLPADRAGILRAYRSLIDQANDPSPDLPGVVGDFLKQLIRFGALSDLRNEGTPRLAEGLEKNMLQGLVDVETSLSGLPSFSYRPEGWKKALPLTHASSIAAELAPVVLYLRHLVRPGHTLIIEEPEAHLHPAMQAEFTRRIASFVHAGVRVIVTTHSEWVLETLANLVRLSDLPKAQRKETKGGDLALRPDQVGAWLFKSAARPKGSLLEPLELDPETGLFQTDFDPVGEALYNEGVRISNRLREGGKA